MACHQDLPSGLLEDESLSFAWKIAAIRIFQCIFIAYIVVHYLIDRLKILLGLANTKTTVSANKHTLFRTLLTLLDYLNKQSG
jgi:hypothetical protein